MLWQSQAALFATWIANIVFIWKKKSCIQSKIKIGAWMTTH
jgi:hypothetical protein